jgi:hypothetical protein
MEATNQGLRIERKCVKTYMHIHHHSITLGTANNGRNDNERVSGHEIPYTSLFFVAPGPRLKLELECL